MRESEHFGHYVEYVVAQRDVEHHVAQAFTEEHCHRPRLVFVRVLPMVAPSAFGGGACYHCDPEQHALLEYQYYYAWNDE